MDGLIKPGLLSSASTKLAWCEKVLISVKSDCREKQSLLIWEQIDDILAELNRRKGIQSHLEGQKARLYYFDGELRDHVDKTFLLKNKLERTINNGQRALWKNPQEAPPVDIYESDSDDSDPSNINAGEDNVFILLYPSSTIYTDSVVRHRSPTPPTSEPQPQRITPANPRLSNIIRPRPNYYEGSQAMQSGSNYGGIMTNNVFTYY